MKFYAFMPLAKNKNKEKQTSIQLNLSENFSSSINLEKNQKMKKFYFMLIY